MLSVTLRLLSLVALGVAQTRSVSIWVPPSDFQPTLTSDPRDLVASIVGSGAYTTTYVLDCLSQTERVPSPNDKTADSSNVDANPTDLNPACGGFPAPCTIVQGPSTIKWNCNITGPNPIKGTSSVTPYSGNCQLSGTTEAVCAATNGTQSLPGITYHNEKMKYATFAVAAGAVTSTSTPISAPITEHIRKEINSTTLSHIGIDSGADATTRDPSARTKAMSGSSGLSVYHPGSIAGISSVKASASTSTPPKSTNLGVQRSSSHKDGVFGALVIALAGAIL